MDEKKNVLKYMQVKRHFVECIVFVIHIKNGYDECWNDVMSRKGRRTRVGVFFTSLKWNVSKFMGRGKFPVVIQLIPGSECNSLPVYLPSCLRKKRLSKQAHLHLLSSKPRLQEWGKTDVTLFWEKKKKKMPHPSALRSRNWLPGVSCFIKSAS